MIEEKPNNPCLMLIHRYRDTWIAAETGCTSGAALRRTAAEGGDRKGISGSTGDHIGG